jgi:hypothetical protein
MLGLISARLTMTSMKKIATWVDESLMTLELAFDLWRGVLMYYGSTPTYQQLLYREFFQELNYGWYAMNIYPYDDPYGVVKISSERKLRLSQ